MTNHGFYLMLSVAATFAWMLPPFCQRNGKYFSYFLIISLSEVAVMTERYCLHSIGNIGYLFFTFLLLPAFKPSLFRSRGSRVCLVLLQALAIGQVYIFHNLLADVYIIVAVHVVLCIFMFSDFIIAMMLDRIFPLFLFLLLFIEVDSILKVVNALFGTPLGLAFFNISIYLDIAFAVFFSVVPSTLKWMNISLPGGRPEDGPMAA